MGCTIFKRGRGGREVDKEHGTGKKRVGKGWRVQKEGQREAAGGK